MKFPIKDINPNKGYKKSRKVVGTLVGIDLWADLALSNMDK